MNRKEKVSCSRMLMLFFLYVGIYSLRCYDCWVINIFVCVNVRICFYYVRRCLTVFIRKYLFFCFIFGELVILFE